MNDSFKKWIGHSLDINSPNHISEPSDCSKNKFKAIIALKHKGVKYIPELVLIYSILQSKSQLHAIFDTEVNLIALVAEAHDPLLLQEQIPPTCLNIIMRLNHS